jgi:hypothetical protein
MEVISTEEEAEIAEDTKIGAIETDQAGEEVEEATEIEETSGEASNEEEAAVVVQNVPSQSPEKTSISSRTTSKSLSTTLTRPTSTTSTWVPRWSRASRRIKLG